MDLVAKLEILADAAKYDVACTSSGIDRDAQKGKLGNTLAAGCCHSFAADGRCITLLKVLMTNVCVYDCAYCVNRASNEVPRAAFKPRELADLTIAFYRRNYIEGLFLSSGVIRNPDYTTELMIQTLSILREEHGFRGYIHAKAVPGTSPELVQQLGHLADRMSVNMELPSQKSLQLLAPQKDKQRIIAPMRQIRDNIAVDKDTRALVRKQTTYMRQIRPKKKERAFVPAGQSTQMIVGASPESDFQILNLSAALYRTLSLKRVFFSAYTPVNDDKRLPGTDAVQLNREHRLYQADWLLRFYRFDVTEIIDEDNPFLDPDLDPKANWAINHLDFFPVEVNTAPLEALLRVPGIGVRGANLIVRARRTTCLREPELRKLGIAYKRARFFITCSGSYSGRGVDFSREGAARAACRAHQGRQPRAARRQDHTGSDEPVRERRDAREGPHRGRVGRTRAGKRRCDRSGVLQRCGALLERGVVVRPRRERRRDVRLAASPRNAGSRVRMSRKPAENQPLFPEEPRAEVAYCHDGSLEGLLSAVFEAYARREDPQDIARADVLQPRLGQTVRVIETNEEHAVRVRRGIRRACGDAAYDAVKHASLSDHPDAGTIVYRFIRYAMAQNRPHDCSGCKRRGSCGGACGKFACTGKARRSVLGDLAHPAVEPLHRLARSVMNERHRMLQFLRFEHLENGVWFARCNPAASVIPLLMDWFSGRFNTQPFIIFDEAHNIAGVYEGRDWYLVQTENVDLPDRASEERLMQQAWKRFYDTVAVEARYNLELRRQFMPKRFWKNITEMQEDLPGKEISTR